MPPPTANDPWLKGRHFGIVIDAGSSGSRLQIYSWKGPKGIKLEKGSSLAYTLPKVEKGTKEEDKWVTKVEPGLSSLSENPEDVGTYLRPLLHHAREQIPPSLHHETPLFLLATAGMRLLTPENQAKVLQETCRFFVHHSYFKIDGPSAAGPCGSSVRIITGEEEGLFGWIAVNYLMDGFTGTGEHRTTYGFLDMGGASTQIAFEPSDKHRKDAKNLVDVRLRLLGGEEIHHKVFVTTWLGYGTNQARERYVGKAIAEYDAQRSGDDRDVVPDPCLPKDLELVESPVHTRPVSSHSEKKHHLVGTGSFEQCLQKSSSLLNKNAPCPDSPCLMNGVYVPPIDFSVSHFIGVSEYWYSSEHIFGLGGAYDFVQYERAASEFCSREWSDILKEHERSRKLHRLGGDGEVEQGGKVVETGRWGPQVEVQRLQMQCFKAAWVANVLHEGLGMPRIVDPGGNATTDGDKVEAEAAKKGLGRPTFQSMDSVGDIAITWTLGKMVIEASKEVPPKTKGAKPVVDPIDDIEDLENAPIHPIRPPFFSLVGIEDRITPHLPPSLTRSSLGFSPVLFPIYVFIFIFFLILCFPLRRKVRSLIRSIRNANKREVYGDLMEEGRVGNNGSRPASPTPFGASKLLPSPFRRFFPFTRKPVSPLTTNGAALRSYPSSTSYPASTSARSSPTRSYSFPNNGGFMPTGSTTQYAVNVASISRSPSPAPGYVVDDPGMGMGLGSLMSSRSRNSSMMNLSSLAPRPVARSNSYNNGKGQF